MNTGGHEPLRKVPWEFGNWHVRHCQAKRVLFRVMGRHGWSLAQVWIQLIKRLCPHRDKGEQFTCLNPVETR